MDNDAARDLPERPVDVEDESSGALGVNPFDNMDALAQKATISYNNMSIHPSPKPLKFGTFNNRPINQSGLNSLMKQFTDGVFTPFRPECMIPIMIERGKIKATCISLNVSGAATKVQKLELDESVERIIVLGGHHRLVAVQTLTESYKKNVDSINAKLTKLKKTDLFKTGERADEAKALDGEIGVLEKRIKTLAVWGIVVYDSGTYFTFVIVAYLVLTATQLRYL